MKNLNVLFVSGNWGPEEGRASKFMGIIAENMVRKITGHVDVHNGGTLEELKDILQTKTKTSEVVFWSPNIPNEYKSEILSPKDFNPACTLITYKRNDGGRISYEGLKSFSIANKADILCEVFKDDTGVYQMRIIDSLDTLISPFTQNTTKSVADLVSRIYILRSLSYSRLTGSGEPHKILNPNFEDIAKMYLKFGNKLKELSNNSYILRHLGEVAFRGYMDPASKSNDIVFTSVRHVRLDQVEKLNPSAFVASRLLTNRINFYGQSKPCFNSSTYLRVLSHLPKVDYVFFCNFYVEDAKFTERVLPSQCIEQVGEILRVIRENGYVENFAINLLGCGSMIFLSVLSKMDEFMEKLQVREQPEIIVPEYETIYCDDGETKFISTLKNREIKQDELLEIKFDDGSVSVYKANVKDFIDDENRPHKEAFITMSVKGIRTDIDLVGQQARRV